MMLRRSSIRIHPWSRGWAYGISSCGIVKQVLVEVHRVGSTLCGMPDRIPNTPSHIRHDVRAVWRCDFTPDLNLGDGVLLYPGAGNDWQTPVCLFRHLIKNFRFVDECYDKPKFLPEVNQGSRETHLRNALNSRLVWSFQDSHSIEIEWQCEDGLKALRSLDRSIGIFFYRGDSSEGSDLWWLFDAGGSPKHKVDRLRRSPRKRIDDDEPVGLIHEVLSRLVDGGLIVTDGSKGDGDGYITRDGNPFAYPALSEFLGKKEVTPEEAMRESKSFTGPLGHSFHCVGCLDRIHSNDKGPTLIWQIRKPVLSEIV
jgi:hypothetical protein